MTTQQIELQRAELIAGDGRLSQCAEAGVDAIHGLGARRFGPNDRTRTIDTRCGLRRQRDIVVAVGDPGELFECQ